MEFDTRTSFYADLHDQLGVRRVRDLGIYLPDVPSGPPVTPTPSGPPTAPSRRVVPTDLTCSEAEELATYPQERARGVRIGFLAIGSGVGPPRAAGSFRSQPTLSRSMSVSAGRCRGPDLQTLHVSVQGLDLVASARRWLTTWISEPGAR